MCGDTDHAAFEGTTVNDLVEYTKELKQKSPTGDIWSLWVAQCTRWRHKPIERYSGGSSYEAALAQRRLTQRPYFLPRSLVHVRRIEQDKVGRMRKRLRSHHADSFHAFSFPILFFSQEADPVTPLSAARAMVERFGPESASLVIQDG